MIRNATIDNIVSRVLRDEPPELPRPRFTDDGGLIFAWGHVADELIADARRRNYELSKRVILMDRPHPTEAA